MLTTEFSYRVTGTLSKVVGALSNVLKPTVSESLALASGVGLDQADKIYYARPTIAGSATLTLDVATGGGLEDIFGDAFELAKLKLIAIKCALPICPNVVNLQQPAANGVPLFLAAGEGLPIRPGGSLIWIAPDLAGVAVTAATGDLIDLVNTAAGTVQPELILIGTSS